MTTHREQALAEAVVTGAGVVDRDRIVLVVQADMRSQVEIEEGPVRPSRVIFHNRAKNVWTWKEFPYGDFPGGVVAAGPINGVLETLVANHLGEVVHFDFGNPKMDYEGPIEMSILPSARRIRLLGSSFYACTGRRRLARRFSRASWELIGHEPFENYRREVQVSPDLGQYGFAAFDGFNESDIYAAGGRGDLWHFDGRNWTRLNPETDWMIMEMRCGGDGLVYIGGQDGELLVGNKDQGWRELQTGEEEDAIGSINEMAWFQDHLYAATDDMLYRWEADRFEPVQFEGDMRPGSFGFVSANDGVLMAAGPFDAAVYDGQRWDFIYGGISKIDYIRGRLAEEATEKLARVRDGLLDLKAARDGESES